MDEMEFGVHMLAVSCYGERGQSSWLNLEGDANGGGGGSCTSDALLARIETLILRSKAVLGAIQLA